MKTSNVLIFVVCYKAESTIEQVLNRIPETVWQNETYSTEVLIIDDQSPDETFLRAQRYSQAHPGRKINVLYNPRNLGYGGNQKVGYHYAIQNGFDAVVLLHGDGQYAPEYLPQMIAPILEGRADAVFGSRMMRKWDALKGRMPLYKWLGNQILTGIQNRILHSKLTEFHSGYRAYRVSVLQEIPFEYNADYFDFDTDIIIQLLDSGKRIAEIPIPTFYGDEICRVNGLRYAGKIIYSSLLSRLNRMGLYYHPRFDYTSDSNTVYQSKFGFPSSHQIAYDSVKSNTTVLDIGCGPGYMARALAEKQVRTISVDRQIQPETKEHSWRTVEANVESYPFDESTGKVDMVLMLDIIEHLKSPETFMQKLRIAFANTRPDILITTGNVGFWPIRLNLLFGGFHFGKRGILDMDHTRLFTFASLTRLLRNQGYEIIRKEGIPAPFPLAIGDGAVARFLLMLNRWLIRLSQGLFSYQIAVLVRPLPTLDCLLKQAHEARQKMLDQNMPDKT